MSKSKKENRTFVISPVGTASYPYLTRPDTKFHPEGEYRVTLLVPEVEAQEMIQAIDQAMTEALEKAKAENPQKARKIQMAKAPYSESTDEDGNPTGDIQFTFKLKAKVTPRKGDPYEQSPKLFDASGTPIFPKNLRMSSGSRVKVNAELVPYFTDLLGAGITLRLKAVQVIELIEYNGHSADRYGFKEEEGYTQGDTHSDDEFSDDESDF